MVPLSYPQKNCGLPLKEALKRNPALKKFLTKGENRIDLGDSNALLLYNRLILQDFLSLDFNIPPGFLIPTVCSRWSFISWIIRDNPSRVLEVGTGASAIIALMLAKVGCDVEATELNEIAYQSAQNNIKLNGFCTKISLMKVNDHSNCIKNYFDSLTKFDGVICNPPQYDYFYYKNHYSHILHKGFVGQKEELVGGIKGEEFIIKLIDEVNTFSNPPNLYFQLTLPKLENTINSYLIKNRYSFSKNLNKIGTRRRYYFRVEY